MTSQDSTIAAILEHSTGYILFKEGHFIHVASSKKKEQNRETLLHFYNYLVDRLKAKGRSELSVRSLFNELALAKKNEHSLPKIIREDAFLNLYALGSPLSVEDGRKLLFNEKNIGKELASIVAGTNEEGEEYYNVNATPPGIMAKVFPAFRLKVDQEMLEKVRYDLELAAKIEDNEERKAITFSLLSFSAAYRELNNQLLALPDFTKPGYLVLYKCKQHLLAEGVKTISLSAGKGYPAIYLCQGTEIWPSQPYMLGSILANFAEHGSASQAYAHSWRRIHKQLRDLTEESGHLPIVIGHSMGGSLALQIALFSHDLIEAAHAYNPPAAGERDALFYKGLPTSIKNKCNVYVTIDDPAFWRIGAKVIGNVTLFLGQQRWSYYPITKVDAFLIFPAILKLLFNIKHAFPAHQKIILLCKNYISVRLSAEEIAIENEERVHRFDYLHFFPKLYNPLNALILLLRKLFKWRVEEELLRNEIEILALHERDLIDTRTERNREEVSEKLKAISGQKHALQKRLFSIISNK